MRGQQGWGGLGLHILLGFIKVKRPGGRWRRGGETGVSTRSSEGSRRRREAGGVAVSRSVGTYAERRKHVRLHGFPSSSMELMPPAEAAKETREPHFWDQDRASLGLLGQGVEGPGTAGQCLFLRW